MEQKNLEMSKEKQIEEMAERIYGNGITHDTAFHEDCRSIARDLYNAGYRKQSEKDSSKGCEYCKGRAYTKKPLTVITKYRRRIELVFEFCPNCGRKMKGGAE